MPAVIRATDGLFEVVASMPTGGDDNERVVLLNGDGKYVVAVTRGMAPTSWWDGEYEFEGDADARQSMLTAFMDRCRDEAGRARRRQSRD